MSSFIEKIKNILNKNIFDKSLYCSFCKRPSDKVLALVRGPKINICNDCVDVCNDILLENGYYISLPKKKYIVDNCSFCGKHKNEVKKIISFCYNTNICNECIDLISNYYKDSNENIIENKELKTCSFCKKEFSKIYKNKEFTICEECIELCENILKECQ